jgi:hypothetical protein
LSTKKFTNGKKFTDLGERLLTLLNHSKITQQVLAEKIHVSTAVITGLKTGRTKGSHRFWEGIHQHYPAWEPYLRGETEHPPGAYEQETPVPLGHEPRPGSYGVPDLGAHRVRTLYEPSPHMQYLQAVEEILESGELGVAEALKSTIIQFLEAVRLRKRLQTLERDHADKSSVIEELRKEVESLKSKVGCESLQSGSAPRNAGNGE